MSANDDLRSLVENRIATHKNAEAAKEEAQRERIRAEEVAKLEREQVARENKARKEEEDATAATALQSIARARVEESLPNDVLDALEVVAVGLIADTTINRAMTAPPAKRITPLTLIERLRRPVVRVNSEVALLVEAALEAAIVIEDLLKESAS